MTPLLANADREFKAAIQRVEDKKDSLYYKLSASATTGDPLKEIENVKGYRSMWLKKVAALKAGDVDGENRLLNQAKTYIMQANALIGIADEVSLGEALKFTIVETAKDLKKPLETGYKWLPYVVGAAVLVVLAGLFYRARGR